MISPEGVFLVETLRIIVSLVNLMAGMLRSYGNDGSSVIRRMFRLIVDGENANLMLYVCGILKLVEDIPLEMEDLSIFVTAG